MMPSRSGMAAVVLALFLAGSGRGQSETPLAVPPIESTIKLQLLISGLSQDGCILKIEPGHPGCRFKPVERRITLSGGQTGGMTRLDPITFKASTLSADRDCSFAITLTEPGQPPRTYRRGTRLTAAPGGQPSNSTSQTVKVYLSAPSLAARDSGTTRR